MLAFDLRRFFGYGSIALVCAAFVGGCSGGGGSTSPPVTQPTSSASTTPSSTTTTTASNGAGPFVLPPIGGFSGTLGESIVSAGATHASVPVQISAAAGPPNLPSGVTLSTKNLSIFFSFAQTFAPGTTGDAVTLGNPFATTLTLPASFSTANVLFFSQLCYYTAGATNAFSCDANSVQAQSVAGSTLVDDNSGAQFPATSGAGGTTVASIPYGTIVYKIFFTVAGGASPTAAPTQGPPSAQSTTIPLATGNANFVVPPTSGYSATLNESVTAIVQGAPTTSSMLLTASNGVPSPLPSGATITPTNATVFYAIAQQVAPGALPGSTLSGTVTFANPFAVTLTLPPGFPVAGTSFFSQLCYYYPGGSGSFTCDPNAVAITNVNVATGTLVDTNPGTSNPYWTLANAGGTTTASQTFDAVVYKLFSYPSTSAKSAIRGPSLEVRTSR